MERLTLQSLGTPIIGVKPTGIIGNIADRTTRLGSQTASPEDNKLNEIYAWAESRGDHATIGHVYLTAFYKLMDAYKIEKTVSIEEINNIHAVVTNYLPKNLAAPADLKKSFDRFFSFHKIAAAPQTTSINNYLADNPALGSKKFLIAIAIGVVVLIGLMYYMANQKKP